MSQHASRQVAAGRLDLLVKIIVAGDRRVATALLAPALEQPVDLHVVSLVSLGAAARTEDLVRDQSPHFGQQTMR